MFIQCRYAAQAMQLVDHVACVLYVAWIGHRRRAMKLLDRRNVPRNAIVYDPAANEPPPEGSTAFLALFCWALSQQWPARSEQCQEQNPY